MSKIIFLRTPYNYDVLQASNECALECLDPSLAQQHEKDDADINTIVRRFGLTGQLPDNVRVPQYGDFSSVTNYHEAMIQVRHANEAFMEMPAEIRSRFNNDPGAFVDFVSDDNNRAEAEKLGLVLPKATNTDPAPQGGGVDQSST
jgi:phage internal scaffolding protein